MNISYHEQIIKLRMITDGLESSIFRAGTFHKWEYRSVGSNLCPHLVCSGKSQLSNYANTHCLKTLIQTWLMSYHVKTTLCHDITTYVAALVLFIFLSSLMTSRKNLRKVRLAK